MQPTVRRRPARRADDLHAGGAQLRSSRIQVVHQELGDRPRREVPVIRVVRGEHLELARVGQLAPGEALRKCHERHTEHVTEDGHRLFVALGPHADPDDPANLHRAFSSRVERRSSAARCPRSGRADLVGVIVRMRSVDLEPVIDAVTTARAVRPGPCPVSLGEAVEQLA